MTTTGHLRAGALHFEWAPWMAKESTRILHACDGKQHRVPVAFGDEKKVARALKAALPHAKLTAHNLPRA